MNRLKNILKLICCFLIFFFASYIFVIFLKYGLKIDVASLDDKGIAAIELLISLLLTLLYSFIHFDIIKTSIKLTKEEYGKKITRFISAIIIGYIVLYIAQYVASSIENLLFYLANIERESADNQQLIEQLLGSAPLMMIISACILAPIEEELLFRGAVGKVIKNKKVFIAVSGLIFGLVHVTDSIILIGELILLGVVIDLILTTNKYDKSKKKSLSVIASVTILVLFGILYYFEYGNLFIVIKNLDVVEAISGIGYVLMGLTLAFLYVYNKENILTNIGIHACNNFVAIIIALCLR